VIQITPQMRLLLAVEPVDFRKGIDGLARLCREALASDPFSGTLFVFRNRRGQALKILVYDGQGFWLCQKRLSAGQFRWWPRGAQERVCRLEVHELQLLLWNGDPARCGAAPQWRRLGETGGAGVAKAQGQSAP
jgi:transposase